MINNRYNGRHVTFLKFFEFLSISRWIEAEKLFALLNVPYFYKFIIYLKNVQRFKNVADCYITITHLKFKFNNSCNVFNAQLKQFCFDARTAFVPVWYTKMSICQLCAHANYKQTEYVHGTSTTFILFSGTKCYYTTK